MSTNIDAAFIHAIGGILILGYSMEYYFHLRMYFPPIKLLIYPLYSWDITDLIFLTRSPQEPPPLSFPFPSTRWRIDVYTGSSVLVQGTVVLARILESHCVSIFRFTTLCCSLVVAIDLGICILRRSLSDGLFS